MIQRIKREKAKAAVKGQTIATVVDGVCGCLLSDNERQNNDISSSY